jgi:hypothetical protein
MRYVDRYIYFVKPVGMDGPIKIGCSRAPIERIDNLSRWSPFPLEIIATVRGDLKLERNIHDCFIDKYSHHEWFLPTPELLAGIEAIKGGATVAEAFDLKARKGSMYKRDWSDGRREYMRWTTKMRHVQRRIWDESDVRLDFLPIVNVLIQSLDKDPHNASVKAKLEEIHADPKRFCIARQQAAA